MIDREFTTLKAMNDSGLSQVALSELMNVNRSTVQKYLTDTDGHNHMVTVDEYECTEVYTLWTRRG
jgi:predicted transcriptional regulator